MKYIVRTVKITFYGPSSYFIEDINSTPPVKRVQQQILTRFETKKELDVGEIINIDGAFWVVDEKVFVQDRHGEESIDLCVKAYEGGTPYGQKVYWPNDDARRMLPRKTYKLRKVVKRYVI